MGKKYTVYAPLELLKRTTAIFPDAWKQMEKFHKENGTNGLPSWPDWCYAPIAASIAVATSGAIVANIEEIMPAMTAAQTIAALAPWRLSKEVFVMDPDLELLLYKQADDLDIRSDILMHLPYPCFYVQTSALFFGSQKIDGFFVHLEYDVNDGHNELRFLFVDEDRDTFGYPVYIDAQDIRSSIEQTLKQAHQNMAPDSPYRSAIMMSPDKLFALEGLLKESLQLVLYLCAENSEIKKNPEQDTFMRRSSLIIRDRYAEIRKWDVGVRIGQAVRRYKQASSVIADTDQRQQGHSHASPRPHLRRGHWHNYWTGPTDGERKLILKWTAPTFVGVSDEEIPVVIHAVDSDKGDNQEK